MTLGIFPNRRRCLTLLVILGTTICLSQVVTRLLQHFIWKDSPVLESEYQHWAVLSALPICCVLFVLAYGCFTRHATDRSFIKVALIFAVVLLIGQLVLPTATSTDAYAYVFQADQTLVYHKNPYDPPSVLSQHDPAYTHFHPPESSWRYSGSPYGPAWLIFNSLIMPAHGSMELRVYAVKILSAAAFILSLIFIVLILRRSPKEKLNRTLFLIAWNPFILSEMIGNGHNDIFIISLILGSIIALEHRPSWAILLAFMSGLIKLTALVLLPLIIYATLRKLSSGLERWRHLARAVSASLVLAAVLYLPFWDHWSFLKPLLVDDLHLDIDRRGLLPLVFSALAHTGRSALPPWLNGVSGIVFYLAVLSVGYLACAWILKKRPTLLLPAMGIFYFVTFAVVTSYSQPWYYVLPIYLVALGSMRHGVPLVLIFTIIAPLLYPSQPITTILFMLVLVVYWGGSMAF